MNDYNQEQPIMAKSDNDVLVENVDNILSTKLAEIKNNENLKMRLIGEFLSLPTNILKMSKYYYSVQFDGIKPAIIFKNISITYKDNIRKVVSIHSYLKHLFINRKYKKTSANTVSIIRYGIYNMVKDDQSKPLDKFDIINLFGTDPKNKNGYQFFVDYYTICRVFKSTSSSYSSQYVKSSTIKIEFIGLNANKYYRNIYRIATHIKPSSNEDSYIISIRKPFTKNGDRFMQNTTIKLTNFNNICCKDGLVDLLKKKVSSFMKAGELYAKYQINNTFGILFYGVPGTGKTSLIKSIMHYLIYEYNTERNPCFSIYSLDVSVSSKELSDAIEIINESITDTSVNNIPDLYIIFIIIEEIDSIMNTSRNNDNGEINSKIKILLEFLDGMNTPNGGNIIFLASTNYYEKLDPALIRCGRFDLKIEMEEFGTDEVIKMCKIYNVSPEDIYTGVDKDVYLEENYRVSPALLQSQILNYLAKDL